MENRAMTTSLTRPVAGPGPGPSAALGRRTDDLPPPVQLLMLTHGKRISQVVYAVAKLGVADLLAEGPLPVEELAEAAGVFPEPLYRVLRVAAGAGVLAEPSLRTFALTPVGAGLRTGVPGSMRDMVLLNGEEESWRPYGEILHTVRTGQPAFEHIYGVGFFEHLRQHPEIAAIFDGAMTQMSKVTGKVLAHQGDFSRFAEIADVGGGRGHFLADVLATVDSARGVLVDQAAVVEGAADAYLLKAVLHDWDDEQASRILAAVRGAIGDRPDARLFIGEQVVAAPGEWDAAKLVDLDMMLRFGGQERTYAQWHALVSAAGFDLVSPEGPAGWRLLECRPV
jgi:hypothetical protein